MMDLGNDPTPYPMKTHNNRYQAAPLRSMTDSEHVHRSVSSLSSVLNNNQMADLPILSYFDSCLNRPRRPRHRHIECSSRSNPFRRNMSQEHTGIGHCSIPVVSAERFQAEERHLATRQKRAV
jgi:hypothetical protein